jgi:hypothetical protein
MISQPTVLILGAGASMHSGYPSGEELVHQILNVTVDYSDFPGGWTKENAEAFLKRLQLSGSSSIDAFLGLNDEDVPLGKYLIAKVLKKCESIGNLFGA